MSIFLLQQPELTNTGLLPTSGSNESELSARQWRKNVEEIRWEEKLLKTLRLGSEITRRV